MLIATSPTEEDQLEWVGLVESKIRHLIGALERNEHITLAHINPEQFDPLEKEGWVSFLHLNCISSNLFKIYRDSVSTLWFIGLEFKKAENLNIDLTDSITAFTTQGNLSRVLFAIFILICFFW